MALIGIDVSRYQGNIDWNQVKNSGISFAMLRGGYGQNNIDPFFHQKTSLYCANSAFQAADRHIFHN